MRRNAGRLRSVGALRNEDYVAFLDESGEPGLEVVAGVLIPARWLRPAEHRWRTFIRNELGSRSGLMEVKGRDLIRGTGVSIHAQSTMLAKGWPPISAEAAGRSFYKLALGHIGTIAEVRYLAVGLPTKYPLEVYRLWFWMAYAALIERPQSPRPKLPMTIIDGQDARFRQAQDLVAYRFYKNFRLARPYMKSGNEWFIGGAVHQDSELHPFVQMADLVAGAARHSIAKRKRLRSWYKDQLIDLPGVRKTPRDPDISGRALDLLKNLSPDDACGSGWKKARLPG